jgi:hypothetical protein
MKEIKRIDGCKAGEKVQRWLLRKFGTYTVVRRNGMTVEVVTQDGRSSELYCWDLVEAVGEQGA